MERIIKDEISRLENISKFMEMGNSMFTTAYAFDCFAQAVKHELIYAHSEFMELVNSIDKEGSELIFYYIDYGEDWLAWRDKFQYYARHADEAGIGSKRKWSLWSDERLHPDKMYKKEINENYPNGKFHKIIDLRDKHEIRRNLENLARYMEQLHEKTKFLNAQIATDYFDLKYDEFLALYKKTIIEKLDPDLYNIPSVHLLKNTDEIIWKEGEHLKEIGFERFLRADYNTDRYFYPEGIFNKETAGKYLAKYTKELTSEQKGAFLKYVLVREKVEEFVNNKTKAFSNSQKLSHTERVTKAIETTHTEFSLKKKEFSLLYMVMKATIDEKCSIKKTMGFIKNTNIPSDQKPSESSLKALTTNKKYPDWNIIDSSSEEMERYNKIAKFFLDKYEKMTI